MTPKQTIFGGQYLEIIYFLIETLTEVLFQNKIIHELLYLK